VLRAWIARGARGDVGPEVRRVDVSPREHRLARPGEAVALRVRGEFADGSREDLTPFCDFRVKDDSIAEVSPKGEVRRLRPGDPPVIVSYRGSLASARVLVPVPGDGAYPDVPTVNYIDEAVFAKLRLLNVVPSDLSSDAEFLRRVTIDTVGCLPAPDEVRAFLADSDPNKRAKKIDELLAH